MSPKSPSHPFLKNGFTYLVQHIIKMVPASLLLTMTMAPQTSQATDQPIEQYLQMDLSQLLEVTITSVSKKPQTLADTAAAVYVISQEDIRRSGVTTIPEALAMAPGVHVAQISSSKWSVSARGFAGYTSNKLLVLLDGRSVYSPAYGGTFWDMPHTLLEDIDRIEVIRGPGGTIWGANAVNGVINIITKNSVETQGGLVFLGGGNHEEIMAAARYGGKLSENVYGRLYVTKNDRDSYTLSSSGMDGSDSWENHQVGFRVDGNSGDNTEWSIQGDAYKNSGDQLIFPFWLPAAPYLTANAADLDNSGANIIAGVAHSFTNGQKLSLQMYYDYNIRDEEAYNLEFNTFDIDLNYEITLGVNTVSLGAGYRNIDSSFDESFHLSIPDNINNLYSAFIQDEIRLFKDRLITTFGLKWEHNDFTGDELQPSAKILWKPVENHSLWASIARAVRTPTLIEHTGRLVIASLPTPFGPAVINTFGNEEFDSETVYAYETGYRWQTSANLSFDLALFYNDYEDLYGFVPRDASMTSFLFENTTEAESYGLETAIKWRPKEWLNVELTYAYLEFNASVSDLVTASNFTNALFETTSPTHQIGLRCSTDITEQWQINGWLRYQDETESRSSGDLFRSDIIVEEFFTLDLNVVWRPRPNLEIMVAGKNLLEGERLQYAAEAITMPTEVERSVFAKVTWQF